MAAGGGGSSGFGGGGGSSGGGGSASGGSGGGGGFGGGNGIGGGEGEGFVVIAGIVVVAAFVLIPVVISLSRRWSRRRARTRRRGDRQRREQLTHRAAAEAAEDGAHFAPTAVEAAARTAFLELQAAWDGRDYERLRALAGEDLYVEWRRRLSDFAVKGWHNRVKVTHAPRIRYVGLENRVNDAEDRVVVAVECRLEDYVVDGRDTVIKRKGERSTKVHLYEYWTLAWTPSGWRIDSIQGGAEGEHHLDAPLVPLPWADVGRLHDAAMVEGAVADAAPPGSPAPVELVGVDYADDARAAALDLSLVDGRFAPAVLEAAVRRAVPAWMAAIDGADDQLLRVATPQAARALLHPDPAYDGARLVVRGAIVDDVRIATLDPDAEPARMVVEVALRGRRYVEDRNTAAVLSGDRDRETRSTEHLHFALDGDDPAVPWRLVGRGQGSSKRPSKAGKGIA